MTSVASMPRRLLLLLACLLLLVHHSDAGESSSSRLLIIELTASPLVIVVFDAPHVLLVVAAPSQDFDPALITDGEDDEFESCTFFDPVCALTKWGVRVIKSVRIR